MYHLRNEISANIIPNYHLKRPFSSFLAGVAGVTGIPIWCFYTNRGQGISGFGIKDKNFPIMEFYPANLAYQYVSTYGFRTFIKINSQVIEPFIKTSESNQRNLGITKDSFYIEEILEKEELIIRVTYSTLNQLPLGGLIRRVEIKNFSNKTINIEVIDGMPALIPYGVTNTEYKEMSNLFRSWMEVSHVEEKVPFYKLRSSTSDEAEVEQIEGGYFYMNNSINNKETMVIYDAKILFSYKTDFSEAIEFKTKSISELASSVQISENKVPCAFQGEKCAIKEGESYLIDSVIGYAKTYDQLAELYTGLDFHQFITNQIDSSSLLVESLTADIETHSNNEQLNAYFQQCYLDNILRGGKPLILSENEHVCHIYSRKHGDQEREYNFFSLEPKYFSQGNGNYRDVNQNRRHDVIFEPRVRDFNIWMFYSLVQSDGYNPLSINGIVYHVEKEKQGILEEKIQRIINEPSMVIAVLKAIDKAFTPGDLIDKVKGYGLDAEQILKLINLLLGNSTAEIEATFGEGYWSDHFTYNLDLVEDFLTVYPDKVESLLFKRMDYKIFNSPEFVLPRNKRIGKTKSGQIRQFGSLQKKSVYYGKWVKDTDGNIIQTNLFNKMLILAVTKFLNLDPSGMGLEMEANKPGWNDAMNGLPGLFGSGMSESIELLRHIRFLNNLLAQEKQTRMVDVFRVISQLIESIITLYNQVDDSWAHTYEEKQSVLWNQRNHLKESYRESTVDYFDSTTEEISLQILGHNLEVLCNVLEQGIERALVFGKGIMPTYWVHEVTKYTELEAITPYGLQAVEPIAFLARQLPYFLEAPARYMKNQSSTKAFDMFEKIRESGIYDQQLKMYKTSESLESETMEIGRIRAFTPGWLERESVFLHMSYKYLLGLAKANLWEEFYETAKTNLIPFLDQDIYGRPITENSSFIASSVNPDPDLVGQGFVARLSGSTAEALSMWKLMMVGKHWFQVEDKDLTFTFDPHLTSDLFDAFGKCSFQLFSKTQVTYINTSLKQTFGAEGAKIHSIEADQMLVEGSKLKGALAYKLREGKIHKITVVFC